MFPIRWPYGSAASSPQTHELPAPTREINKVYATLTTFTDPLFRSMADGLQGLERAPGLGRR